MIMNFHLSPYFLLLLNDRAIMALELKTAKQLNFIETVTKPTDSYSGTKRITAMALSIIIPT